MNDHLERSCTQTPITSMHDMRGKILVFCESGNERSTVLVCAYLMFVYGVDAVTAIHIVQSQRFCIDVKDEMKNMLLDLEAILVAERQVASAGRNQHDFYNNMSTDTSSKRFLNQSSKRSIDRAYEDDEEMGDAEDWPFTNGDDRVGVAPFADSGT